MTKENKVETMATRIKRLRQAAGLSQNDLAKHLGVSRVAVLKYEKGCSRPVRRLDKIASILGTTADYLLVGKTEKKESRTKVLSEILLPSEVKLLKIYRQLDDKGKAVIDAAAGALESFVKNNS